MIFGGESSYTVVAIPATLQGAPVAAPRRLAVRPGRIAACAAISVGLIALALHLKPFMPAGADLADPLQRLYAANLWGQVQVSLAVIGCFLPWFIYALVWRGAPLGTVVLAVLAAAGTVLGTWITIAMVDGYAALPRSVSGTVARVDGRLLQLTGPPGRYYLALSDAQLQASGGWLKRGTVVQLWVSPRGQVGAMGPAVDAG